MAGRSPSLEYARIPERWVGSGASRSRGSSGATTSGGGAGAATRTAAIPAGAAPSWTGGRAEAWYSPRRRPRPNVAPTRAGDRDDRDQERGRASRHLFVAGRGGVQEADAEARQARPCLHRAEHVHGDLVARAGRCRLLAARRRAARKGT